MLDLWVLTEERPKTEVLRTIFKLFAESQGGGFIDIIRIIPILDKERNFSFTYEVLGFKAAQVNKVYLKTISGSSSFVDYLIYHQAAEPVPSDSPLIAIEETKTDDAESRNTGVFQRATKFVFIKNVYPEARLIMLYNLQIEQKKTPTATNNFGTRCFKTIGVEIIGKVVEKEDELSPFKCIDELIEQKNSMRRPPEGNIPILISKQNNTITVSGRLFKSGSLSHDPNIGALSLISSTLRILGWKGRIVLTQHELTQKMLSYGNKMIAVCRQHSLEMEGLTLPQKPDSYKETDYWRYESTGEKLGTIFLHLIVESFTRGYSIFENHAGCEKGYFIDSNGSAHAIVKYKDSVKYKAGDLSQIIHIPDLILIDGDRVKVINIEGKQYKNKLNGIHELNNFDAIESVYIAKHYPQHVIIRTVVLYGSKEEVIKEVEVGFLLNEDGKLVLGPKAPELFTEAIQNLLNFFGKIST